MRALACLIFVLGGAAQAAEVTPGPDEASGREGADLPGASATERTDGAASKKQKFLDEKHERRAVHARHPAALVARPTLSLRNMWTHEVLPLDPALPPSATSLNELLRDHYTNQAAVMDPRLSSVILTAAAKFEARFIEVVSGYRAPKYNLMLRKKGHAVARESQHPLGHAVDFRLEGVSTRALYRFVRSLRLGGVGYYPHSGFVHADVGPIRTWKGQ